MTLLCVDEDTPRELAPSIARLRPAWDVVFAVNWAGGGIKDPVLLELLWQDRRALISKDRATLADWIKERQARGLDHAGVFWWDVERFQPRREVLLGALARATVQTVELHDSLVNVADTIR